jgi:hypothetical protein
MLPIPICFPPSYLKTFYARRAKAEEAFKTEIWVRDMTWFGIEENLSMHDTFCYEQISEQFQQKLLHRIEKLKKKKI